jgi:hypothetical protein
MKLFFLCLSLTLKFRNEKRLSDLSAKKADIGEDFLIFEKNETHNPFAH